MNIVNDIYLTEKDLLACSAEFRNPQEEPKMAVVRKRTFANFQRLVLKKAFAVTGPSTTTIRVNGSPCFRVTLDTGGYFKTFNDEPSVIELQSVSLSIISLHMEGINLHRLTGPAYISGTDPNDVEWWVRGEHMETREDFVKHLKTEQERIDGLRALLEYTGL